jgi:GntR family transcriptional regulator
VTAASDRERVRDEPDGRRDRDPCRANQSSPELPLPRLPDQTLELFAVDKQEPTELFEQVAAEIRRAIADGEAKAGERLPPARDLAAVLGVNTNTVLRSLRLPRDKGLLEFRRGRGVTVAGTPERGAVIARARELVRFARQQGYRRDELIELIEEIA